MNRDEALRLLPPAYASAIELERGGATNGEIADALSVDVDAIPALLRIGHAKLARLLTGDRLTPSRAPHAAHPDS